MNKYKARAYTVGAIGFLTQSDHYKDYEFESEETLEAFAGRLASKGFFDEDTRRWIMPGAIIWVEQR